MEILFSGPLYKHILLQPLQVHVCDGVGPQVLPTLVTALPPTNNINKYYGHMITNI